MEPNAPAKATDGYSCPIPMTHRRLELAVIAVGFVIGLALGSIGKHERIDE